MSPTLAGSRRRLSGWVLAEQITIALADLATAVRDGLVESDAEGGRMMTLTCGELRGFEPLTPCMPCHPHHSTRSSAAMHSTTSPLLRDLARRSAVMRREALCGIAADNLLTDRGHGAFSSWASVETRLLELGTSEIRFLEVGAASSG
jgi:hypothetical protein